MSGGGASADIYARSGFTRLKGSQQRLSPPPKRVSPSPKTSRTPQAANVASHRVPSPRNSRRTRGGRESAATSPHPKERPPSVVCDMRELSLEKRELLFNLLLREDSVQYESQPDGSVRARLLLKRPILARALEQGDDLGAISVEQASSSTSPKTPARPQSAPRSGKTPTSARSKDAKESGEDVKFKPKKRALPWVQKWIRELFDARYQHYSFEIENEEVFQDFSDFVSNYLEKKFGLGHMIKKTQAELTAGCQEFRAENPEVDVFTSSLSGFFDSTDLLFFLLTRKGFLKHPDILRQKGPAGATSLLLARNHVRRIGRSVLAQQPNSSALLSSFEKSLDQQTTSRSSLSPADGVTPMLDVHHILMDMLRLYSYARQHMREEEARNHPLSSPRNPLHPPSDPPSGGKLPRPVGAGTRSREEEALLRSAGRSQQTQRSSIARREANRVGNIGEDTEVNNRTADSESEAMMLSLVDRYPPVVRSPPSTATLLRQVRRSPESAVPSSSDRAHRDPSTQPPRDNDYGFSETLPTSPVQLELHTSPSFFSSRRYIDSESEFHDRVKRDLLMDRLARFRSARKKSPRTSPSFSPTLEPADSPRSREVLHRIRQSLLNTSVSSPPENSSHPPAGQGQSQASRFLEDEALGGTRYTGTSFSSSDLQRQVASLEQASRQGLRNHMNPHRDQSSGVPHSLWLEDATTLRAPGHADTHETRSTETPQLKGGAVDSLGSVPSSSKTVQWRADVVAQSVGSDFADTGFSSRPKSKSPGSSGQTPLQREEDDSAASVRQSGHSWCPPGEDEEEDEDVTLAARDYDDPSLQDDRSFRDLVETLAFTSTPQASYPPEPASAPSSASRVVRFVEDEVEASADITRGGNSDSRLRTPLEELAAETSEPGPHAATQVREGLEADWKDPFSPKLNLAGRTVGTSPKLRQDLSSSSEELRRVISMYHEQKQHHSTYSGD